MKEAKLKSPYTTIYMPLDLHARLKQATEKIGDQTGLKVTPSKLAQKFIRDALDQLEQKKWKL